MSKTRLSRVHHIAFVVRDLDAAIERYESLLGIPMSERGPVATRGGEVAIFKLDNVNLEIVAPASEDSPLWRVLERQGEGFFHMAFGVDDVDAACDALEQRGVRMKSRPYTAYKDWRIAYLDDDQSPLARLHIIDADAD